MNRLAQPLTRIIGKCLRLADVANLLSVSKQFEHLNMKLCRKFTLALDVMTHFSGWYNKSTTECMLKYIAHLVLGCPYSSLQQEYSPFADNNMLPHLVNIWMCQSGNESEPIDIVVYGVSNSDYVYRYYDQIRRHLYGSKNKEFGTFQYIPVDQGKYPNSAMISFNITFRGETARLDYLTVGQKFSDKRQIEIYQIFKHRSYSNAHLIASS